MVSLDDDPFGVSQPLEIQSILTGLLSQRALVRLDIPGHAVSVISTLLDIDHQAGSIVLDNASDDEINRQLLQAPSVRLQGLLDKVMIEFSGPLSPALHEGRPALSMEQPRQLRRMQRRELFRIEVPASSTAACVIRDPSFPGEQIRFRMLDISAGGVRLADATGALSHTAVGTIFDTCTLELGDTGSVDVRLRLQRHAELIQENDKRLQIAALRFFKLPTNRQVTIQQFVGSLERAVMSRRWGMD